MTEPELDRHIEHELAEIVSAARRVLADVERCRRADVLTVKQASQLRSMERLARMSLAAALEYRNSTP